MTTFAMTVAAVFVAGCATASWLVVSPDGQIVQRVEVDQWVRAHPLPAGQAIAIHEIGRSGSASFHVVQVVSREQPHVHKTHDATVLVTRGRGTLWLGPHHLRLGPGSFVNIPRNVVHHFVVESAGPAVALVVFSPPLDGADYHPVEDAPPDAVVQ